MTRPSWMLGLQTEAGLHLRFGLVLCTLAWVTACDSPGADSALALPEIEAVLTPAVAGSGMPFVAGDGRRIWMSWTEPTGAEGEYAVRVATFDGQTWYGPHTVAQGSDFFVNWADFPVVAPLPDGGIAANWLVRHGDGRVDYDIHMSVSADEGRTWSAPVIPHRDGVPAEHGFVSMLPWGDGGVGAVWLDGRKFHEHQVALETGGPPVEREMTLRHAVLHPDGTLGPEALLDDRICDCCQTSAAQTNDGVVVVYRDRSPDELRDISSVRFVRGEWTEPAPVHTDGWVIPACPVNGPAVAAQGNQVVTAWFTAADEVPRVRLAWSTDGGVSWGEPVQVDQGNPVGRVDVVVLPDGTAWVVWLEAAGEGADLLGRRVDLSGQMGPVASLAGTSSARASGFPRMAAFDEGVFLAWTDPDEGRGVQGALLRFPVMEDPS
ncbi:MAG: sialidase family protein [Gemmatimonadota bacterium]